MLGSGLIYALRDTIRAAALRSRLPAVSGLPGVGALIRYAPTDGVVDWLVVADLVDRIIKGAEPADLPMRQATRFSFVVVLQTARAA